MPACLINVLVAQMVKNPLVMLEIWIQIQRPGFDPWVGKITWRREWLPTPAFLPGEFHGQRSLVGYRPWGHKVLNKLKVISCPFEYDRTVCELKPWTSVIYWSFQLLMLIWLAPFHLGGGCFNWMNLWYRYKNQTKMGLFPALPLSYCSLVQLSHFPKTFFASVLQW